MQIGAGGDRHYLRFSMELSALPYFFELQLEASEFDRAI
jgi:hypothetical protein